MTDDLHHGRTWAVDWALSQFQLVYPPFNELDHHEDNLILVKLPHQEGPDGNYDLSPFFMKENDKWVVNHFTVKCEFCHRICDRIHFQDKLTESIDAISETPLPHNKKRKFVYQKFTLRKWEFLGEGNRRKVPTYVSKLVHKFFPVPVGEQAMGFKEV